MNDEKVITLHFNSSKIRFR